MPFVPKYVDITAQEFMERARKKPFIQRRLKNANKQAEIRFTTDVHIIQMRHLLTFFSRDELIVLGLRPEV